MKETIQYLQPVILSLDKNMMNTEFKLNKHYSRMFEKTLKSPEQLKMIADFKFEPEFEEKEIEEQKKKKLKLVCGLAAVSARLVVCLYSDASKPDDVVSFLLKNLKIFKKLKCHFSQKHVARDMKAPFVKTQDKSMFDEILSQQPCVE